MFKLQRFYWCISSLHSKEEKHVGPIISVHCVVQILISLPSYVVSVWTWFCYLYSFFLIFIWYFLYLHFKCYPFPRSPFWKPPIPCPSPCLYEGHPPPHTQHPTQAIPKTCENKNQRPQDGSTPRCPTRPSSATYVAHMACWHCCSPCRLSLSSYKHCSSLILCLANKSQWANTEL